MRRRLSALLFAIVTVPALVAQSTFAADYLAGEAAFNAYDYPKAEGLLLRSIKAPGAPTKRGASVPLEGQQRGFYPEAYLAYICVRDHRYAEALDYATKAKDYVKRGDPYYQMVLAAESEAKAALRRPGSSPKDAEVPGADPSVSRVFAPIGASGGLEELYTGSYALLVSVSRYDDAAAWGPLSSIPAEFVELKSVLPRLGFDSVEEIVNPTGDQLRRGVEDFIRRRGYNPGARLLFFFSGHGFTLDDGRRGYFVPRDAPDPLKAEARFRGVALAMDQVATWARDLTARHALFVFDSCFSGTLFRTRDRLVPRNISALTGKKVRQFLSAGDAGETVPAQSVFTPTFVRALRGDADINRDGFITGTELGNWIQSQVIGYKTGQTPQFGKLRDPQLDEGDFVFAVPRNAGSAGATQFSLSPSLRNRR